MYISIISGICATIAFALAAAAGAAEPELPRVEAQKKPGQPWQSYPTRTLSQVVGFRSGAAVPERSRFGGRRDRKVEATGFFHARKIDGRWWLVDPEGYLYINQAVVSVSPGRSPNSVSALNEKYGSQARWAEATTDLLREHHFNGTGAWSAADLLRPVSAPLPYTRIINFMSGYGKETKRTFVKPGHAGYPDDLILVFEPAFADYCNRVAQDLAKVRDDPFLLGYFTDNEMPFPKQALDRFLARPETDPGRVAAAKWWGERKGGSTVASDITDTDRSAFLGYMTDRYFQITKEAIRKHDPNHMILGSRFHSGELNDPNVFRAAGQHLDLISINYYGAWTPNPERMANWERWSGRPFLITEWYTKGMDSGMANTSGAGWIVRTQADRGRFYQNFALGLLESRVCVGWQWFKYTDNDPADTTTDPSNRDSNKGIVTFRFEPYPPLLSAMKELNREAYVLADHFDTVNKLAPDSVSAR